MLRFVLGFVFCFVSILFIQTFMKKEDNATK